jgi:2-polyprenyl-6-methoxyphenol hydroxylase-like FAD-dependent oxidoreductase
MTISAIPHVQVLIVGAGPTGLTMATVLARYGVKARLVEKKERLSRTTKATNLMQRNQEVLYALGLLESMNDISGFCRRLMIHGYGKSFGPRIMRLNETPFHDVILCGQHNFEAVMAQALLERTNISIEFNTELKHLIQTKDGVVARLESPAGTEEVQCDYVIGCDGAAGVTRTFTKHDFTPTKTGVAIRQADCKLTWKRILSMEQLWFFYFQHGFAVIVPLPGNIYRILVIEPKKNMPEREPTLEELQAKIREVSQDDSVILSDPEWFSYTDLSMGIASGLRDGRIILAGDVGNPILPNGGQGMNSGIGDAFNLGWKLASVINDGAPEILLDTYEQERHTLRNELQNAQHKSLTYTTLITPKWMQALVRRLGDPILNLGGEYKMAQAFSELTINTRKSPLTLEMVSGRGLRAGDRVSDAEIVRGTETVKLFDILYASGWTLLAFTGTQKAHLEEVVDAVETFERADLPCYIVSTSSRITSTVPILYDLDEVAHRAYHVTKPTLYLVRPDGHVGARVSPRNIQQLKNYARKWIPTHAFTLVTELVS